MNKKKLVLCVTGASGAVYAAVIIKQIIRSGRDLHLIFSENGKKIFEYELSQSLADFLKSFKKIKSRIYLENASDMQSPLASGGNDFDVLICPCSMGTLGRVSAGMSSNLIERVSDVALKEKNKLICVFRESPLNIIHMKNMLSLAQAGAIIMPAAPFFYLKPADMDELVTQFAQRILKVFLEDYTPGEKWGGYGAV